MRSFFISLIFKIIFDKDKEIDASKRKKMGIYLEDKIKMHYLCIAFRGKHIMIGLWCNGSTTGFGSVCPGSNPGSPTKKESEFFTRSLFLCTRTLVV